MVDLYAALDDAPITTRKRAPFNFYFFLAVPLKYQCEVQNYAADGVNEHYAQEYPHLPKH